ncbi:MAG TPA: COX15/CtaA family protein [Burkholderiales bacterium]|nr:COX15/CtaA family protein [Burkholderiales bacterium]
MTESDRRRVAAWLLVCAALVFALVSVGGVTRLTRSGLSIVEWQPVSGVLPPLSENAWQEMFSKYQQTPEYRHVNAHFGLEEFKRIFWWEYVHRLLARLVGVVFLLPLLWFQWRGVLDRPLAQKLWGIFALGALQGALGWWMVTSGLVDDPKVSPLRLTMHLGLALAIFAAELWIALGLLAPRGVLRPRLPAALPFVVYAMMLSGAMVAGTRAGYAYPTFPLMNGQLVPPDVLVLEPWWRNFLYNLGTVQFVHRCFFWLLAVLVPLAWWRGRRGAPGGALLAVFALQAALGISTLLSGVAIPLAASHQAGAVLLLAASLWHAHRAHT